MDLIYTDADGNGDWHTFTGIIPEALMIIATPDRTRAMPVHNGHWRGPKDPGPCKGCGSREFCDVGPCPRPITEQRVRQLLG